MSKRGEALRNLIRDVPPPADVKLILDGLDNETDRAAALVAAALLETALERLIRHSLKRKDTELNNQLFQQRGPMGDFHSKIIVASAFGVISGPLAGELTIVRNIRNVFAHATANLSFATPEIKNEIKRSHLLKVINEKASEETRSPSMPQVQNIPIQREFLLLVRIVFIILDHDQKDKGGMALSD
jgi:DNA-binding MltR family transcriptional regulator